MTNPIRYCLWKAKRNIEEPVIRWRQNRAVLRTAPIVFEDIYGIRFIKYSWDTRPLDLLLHREHEKAQFQVMDLLLRPGAVVFDVGANVGFHSVFASRRINPNGKLYAFEPVPNTYWMLRETLALNRCENVEALQMAVTNNNGTAQMNIFDSAYSEYNSLGYFKMPTLEGKTVFPETTLQVPAISIDTFTLDRGIYEIDLLKVDVEGFEKFVFEGTRAVLREHRVKYICFEISKDPLDGAGFKAKDIFQELEASGYQAWDFDPNSRRFLGPIHDSDEHWRNYYASYQDLSSLELSH